MGRGLAASFAHGFEFHPTDEELVRYYLKHKETFKFLNILQVHGFPKVMGVLTYLEKFKDVKKLRKTKQRLKHRFWTEIYNGAKLFYLSGLINGKYSKREVHNLARFISVMKFHLLSWRTSHPYVLIDHFEDVTPPEQVCMNNKCDRNATLYGYLRGCNLKKGTKGWEREVAEAANGGSEELKGESLMWLSWALVHSRQPEDVQRGMAILEGLRSLWHAGKVKRY